MARSLVFSRQYPDEYLERFLTSIAWWTLRPDTNLITQPAGDDPAGHISGARSEKGDLAVLYLPVGGMLKLNKTTLREGLHAEWFNPRTGQKMQSKRSEQGTFRAPDQQDWVLLLSNK